jgi:glutamyl-tRNA(Gln) amidotransferase subunit E
LGSIRQDLNVSIAAGDRVEIKGCQDLGWIPRIIRLEMARQLHFYRLANELRTQLNLPALPPNRDEDDADMEAKVAQAVESALPMSTTDVSSCFAATDSGMVSDSLANGAVMMALPLPGLLHRLGTKALDDDGAQLPRLGRELAGAAKLAGVKGIFHADELPAYGITSEEVNAVRVHLSLGENDGFVLCCAPIWQAELALEAVLNRARMAWHRIPQEVRNVVVKKGAPEDGTTAPMRPLPGRSRMYPETDVQPLKLSQERWSDVLNRLPMSDEERKNRLGTFAMSEDQSDQLLARELDDVFVEHGSTLPPKAWAALLLNHDTESPLLLAQVLQLREDGALSRDHIDAVIQAHSGQSPDMNTLRSYCNEHGLAPADIGGLEDIITALVAERHDFVKERGMGAMGPLMGIVMQAAGGADGKEVSALLRAAIPAIME